MNEKTLKEVSELVGVTRRAVQGYEKAGLVEPSGKNKYGYLLYNEAAVEKIRMVKQYQCFGFTLKEISRLFEVSMEEYVQMMKERLAVMQRELEEMKRNIRVMEEMIKK